MAQTTPVFRFQDPDLPVAERVADLVSRLALEEKVAQMVHGAPAVPRLGIPAYNWWNECLHGVGRAGRATVFPQAIGLAASFDADLMRRVATVISDEARAKHHQALRQGNHGIYFGLTYWSPNINLFRDPRWGRGQETYGEDPYLTARLGVAFVQGLQGDDPTYLKLVATAKHYAVHSGKESERHWFDAVVSQRDLRETYLAAFRALVCEAHVQSIMGAYNRTNGEPCCASPTLLQRILREEWGFDGYVVSDCGAINDIHQHHKVTTTAAESAALAVRNGCDLNCGDTYLALLEAVRTGLIAESALDTALRRLFTARFRLGMFDPPERVPFARLSPEIVGCEAHRRMARRMARESVVLLKNQGGLLPLHKDLRQILVVGPNANAFEPLMGNYNGLPDRFVTPLAGIVGRVAAGTNVVHLKGCDLVGPTGGKYDWLLHNARESDVVIAFMGLSPLIEGEEGDAAFSDAGGDRRHVGLPPVQQELLAKLHETGKPVVLVLLNGSPVAVNWAAENLPAILVAWYPGQEGGNAIADVLFGDCSPAGRLPITFVRSLEQLPPFEDYGMAGRTYRFMTEEPLYRFGFGLSYTRFEYSDLKLSRPAIGPDAGVTVRVTITNVGERAGDEVAQLYVRDVQASVPVPRCHLEGFRRMHLRPGQARRLAFVLTPAQLAAYDEAGRPFVEPGEFVLSVGGGQPDDPASGAVSATLTVRAG